MQSRKSVFDVIRDEQRTQCSRDGAGRRAAGEASLPPPSLPPLFALSQQRLHHTCSCSTDRILVDVIWDLSLQ